MRGAYYNEFDPKTAAWLRELIKAGLIADGDVDERSIVDVRPADLAGYTQCHFFAGIGGWSYALRLAGWPDDRHVWTGSCPCQPYSVASVGTGGAQGHADSRDLWPSWFALIQERQPVTVFGEQVKSALAWGWWDRAALDMESQGYACAAAVCRADASGATHERQRLYWVADTDCQGRQGYQPVDGLPCGEETPFSIARDPLIRARSAVDGDIRDLLPCDGLSVQLERDALKGYGNAIVPQVAAEVIRAYMDIAA